MSTSTDQPNPFVLAQKQAMAAGLTDYDAQFGALTKKLLVAAKLSEAHAARIAELEVENAQLRALIPEEPTTNVSDFPNSGSA